MKTIKTKKIILMILISFIFAGCQVTTTTDNTQIIVSKILKSQQSVYYASDTTATALYRDDILSINDLYHDSTNRDDILSLALHIGGITLRGYGYDPFRLTHVVLDFDLDTLTQDYVYDYQGYLYDDYRRYHFTTSQAFVGYADQLPYKGTMQIISEDNTIVVTVIDDYYIDIDVYNHYDPYYDHTIHTTWRALGF